MDRVYFISRAGFLDPYVIRYSVALGQGQSKEVNVPYIATVGPWDASSLTADLVSASLHCCHQPASKGRCICDTAYLATEAHVPLFVPGGFASHSPCAGGLSESFRCITDTCKAP